MELDNIQVIENDYADLVLDAGAANFGEHYRKTMKGRTKEECYNIIRSACALLNSGGGIITVKVLNEGYNYDIHGIGSDIENGLHNLQSCAAVKSSFNFIQQDGRMLIFVQSWSNGDGNNNEKLPRLCAIKSNAYQRADSSSYQMSPLEFENFITRKTKAAGRSDSIEKDSDLSIEPLHKKPKIEPIESTVFKSREFQFGDTLNFNESMYVEFKDFSGKNDARRIKEALPKYISAFANTNGGYLLIGVTNTRKVVGCGHCIEDPQYFEKLISTTVEKLNTVHICNTQKIINYSINVARVLNKSEQHGFLIILYVEPFCCVVFADKPDCWKIENDQIKRVEPREWTEIILATDPVEFHSSSEISIIPDNLHKELLKEYPNLENLLPKMKGVRGRGVLIFSRSWAVDIGRAKHQDVVCDALLLATENAPRLYTVGKRESDEVFKYSKDTAFSIKQKLVNPGGYTGKLCVIPKILWYSKGQSVEGSSTSTMELGNMQEAKRRLEVRYPKDYTFLNITALLIALTIVLLNFRSFLSDQLGCEFLNLLTLEQFQILHSKHDIEKCKKLFVHGLPGTGKTIIARQLIERIINTFQCKKAEVLYICENAPLARFMRQKTNCTCVTRKTFMSENFPKVKHVIVDEAQNFRLESGDWYEKAESIRTAEVTHPNGAGVFWIFMDYFQMSHFFSTGLPRIQDQDPREELTTGVRNGKEIHKIVHLNMEQILLSECDQEKRKFLTKLYKEANCGHSFPGKVEKSKMTPENIAKHIRVKIKQYLDTGYTTEQMAILCSTQEECKKYRDLLQCELKRLNVYAYLDEAESAFGDHTTENIVTLNSIRRFSGLEKPIVFGINPLPHPDQQVLTPNILVCLASRAMTQLHLLFEN
ncbi:schlafen family member 11-like isoform X2 [Stegostoma tigrinum]|uniref:schlafen family member 11-like isoform X2 n=1 Tax=Stegostoma tigrinum TaxID=3053191 RepID=UPI0028703358|nr:schlafen family member 11-like isoform X2 [Stegostoma tigrinum]